VSAPIRVPVRVPVCMQDGVEDDALAEADDRRFMALALALGRRGLGRTWPNPAVGAVIVKNGVIIGRGWTQPGGRPHAEVEALRRAGAAANDATFGATMYVTLEPCSHHGKSPPCADAVIAAGIARVVSALEDPNPEVAGSGHARLRAAGIAVDVEIGAEEARRDHAGHIRRMRDGRPHVTLKLAVSADGKAAAAGRRPIAITGEAVRERVHLLRAQSDAIMIGIGTALADDPLLTCRLPGMEKRSPVRVVLDTTLRLPLASRLVETARETPVWVIAGPNAPHPALLAEGGPTLAAALIAADLVDEAILFQSAKIVGEDGIDALDDAAMAQLTQRLKPVRNEAIGPDRQLICARE
jgi:diaminohydroxyphosphoribosylaminopyrimidine deaminase/5-amino-6-(5-phosphoribosylamino)uracil reductase